MKRVERLEKSFWMARDRASWGFWMALGFFFVQ